MQDSILGCYKDADRTR